MGLLSMIKRRLRRSGAKADTLSLFGVPIEERSWVPENEFWIIPKDFKVTIQTTPKGDNYFNKLWLAQQDTRSTQKPIKGKQKNAREQS